MQPFSLQSGDAEVSAPPHTGFPGPNIDIDLSLGEPQWNPFQGDSLLPLTQKKKLNHYYPSLGDPELIELIKSDFYQSNTFKNHQLLITNGAIHALDLLFRAHLKHGDEVLIPSPGFPPYERLIKFSHGTVNCYNVALNGNPIDPHQVASKITPNTKFLILNFPHNPTGRILNQISSDALVGVLKDFPHVQIISDEVYGRVPVGNNSTGPHFELNQRSVIVSSLSKSHSLQGMRVGWVTGADHLINPLKQYLQNATGSVSSISQELAKVVLTQPPSTQPWKKALSIATHLLNLHNIDFLLPEGSFFILIPVGDDDVHITNVLKQKGIRVSPGSAFGNPTKGYIRVAFCQQEEQVELAFRSLCEALLDIRLKS